MIKFDGIGFEDLNELLNFLKHSYFAHKTRVETLERTIKEFEIQRDDLKRYVEDEIKFGLATPSPPGTNQPESEDIPF